MAIGQVRQVWRFNIEQEFALIRQIARRCRYASFDTEFPGTVYESTAHPRDLSPEERYALLKANIDVLKLIQLGLTLSHSATSKGFTITWEFNFRDFDPVRDPYSSDSIMLLQSQGIDFLKNRLLGIDSRHFSNLLWSSSLLCNNSNVNWIAFHGASDIGYLVKVLIGRKLPATMNEFLKLVSWYFGNKIFDIKYMITFCDNLYGGLEKVGDALNVERAIGRCHQAGSDSLFTWRVYQKMLNIFFQSDCGIQHAGVVFGLHKN